MQVQVGSRHRCCCYIWMQMFDDRQLLLLLLPSPWFLGCSRWLCSIHVHTFHVASWLQNLGFVCPVPLFAVLCFLVFKFVLPSPGVYTLVSPPLYLLNCRLQVFPQ